MTAIHVASPALTLRAGRRALEHIRERGLSPAQRTRPVSLPL